MSDGWGGRRVLVTGAGGFIGSHLTEHLVRAGAEVRAMVRYTGRGDLGMLTELDADALAGVDIVRSDVTDPHAVRRAVAGCDAVFHLAALIAIPHSYAAPAAYVATNVTGTLNVLEAARDLDVARLVHTSTSETYGTARYTPMDEQHPLQTQSPYAASKAAADHLAMAYHRSFGLPVATVRPFNTYGPRQSTRAVVPAIAAQLLSGSDTIALGDTRPVRDLTYVEDTARGFLAAADTPACVGKVTNLGTGHGVSIGDLAQLLADLAGRPGVRIIADPQRLRPPASEVERLVADATAAHDRCGWRPAVELRDGLARTLAYVRANPDRYDPTRYAT